MTTVKPPSDEDELDDLPPIDGDEVEEEGDETEELDEEPLDGGDPMDDSTGEGDPLEDEEDITGAESGWLDDADESDGLDVGTPDTFGSEDESPTLLEGADEPDLGEDELSFGGGVGGEGDSLVGDAGEEGFEDEEEDLREEDLPRMDSGQDDTEGDDSDLLEGLPDEEVSEEPRPPWDDRAWERVEGAAEVPAVDVLACGADGLVVGGQGLGRIARGGVTVAPLDALGLRGAPRGIALDGGRVFVSTGRAGVLVSDDGGRSFREANGWRSLLVPSEAEGALEIVTVAGELWGRGAAGTLVWSGDGGATWALVLPDCRFEAIAGDATTGELVAVAREVAATTIARGAAGRVVLERTGALPDGRVLALAAEQGRVAVALPRGAFRLEGEVWTRLDGTAGLTAMTFARRDGTLLIALHSEGEGRAWLLEARAGAPALTVAELGDAGGGTNDAGEEADGDDARVRALCWDADAGAVWAAGGFGLAALRPARH